MDLLINSLKDVLEDIKSYLNFSDFLLDWEDDSGDINDFYDKFNQSSETKKILDFLPVGIIIVNKNKYIYYANKQALKMMGDISASEIVGERCYNKVCPRKKRECPILDQGKSDDSSEKKLLGKDGEEIPILKTVIKINVAGEKLLLEAFKDISHIKEYQEQLEYYATRDKMTDVFNRRAGMDLFDKLLERSQKENKILTLIYADINGLKQVNDTHGHKKGDEVIKNVCEIFKEETRDSDVICRIGGDEFLLIFPDCSRDQALKIRERINDKFKNINSSQDKSYQISVSMGLVEYRPEDDRSVNDLIKEADSRMYENKRIFKAKN